MTRLGTVVVLGVIAALAIATPSAWEAALGGLAATVLLFAVHLRYSPTMLGTALRVLMPAALGLTVVALIGGLLPGGVRWLPVAAPVVVVLLFAGVLAPYRSEGR